MKHDKAARAAALCMALLGGSPVARAQSEPFIGQIMWTAANFCPRGWAPLDGQILPIAQNTALFSLLGTQYGGNGQTTFALPDLRGRVPLHRGQGPGLTQRTIGEAGGAEAAALVEGQLPPHRHSLNVSPADATASDGANAVLARAEAFSGRKAVTSYVYGPPGTASQSMAPETIGSTGEATPVSRMQPFLGMVACIALEGVFPPRD